MSISPEVSAFTRICYQKIDELVLRLDDDARSSNRLKAAFSDIVKDFFKDPANFKFNPIRQKELQDSNLQDGVNELLGILKGSSKIHTAPVCEKDQEAITTKINTISQELSRKRKSPEELNRSTRKRPEDIQIEKASLEAMVAALKLVKENGLELKGLKPCFQNNRRIVLAAIEQNGLALQFASEQLRKEKMIVEQAVTKNPLALQFVSTDVEDYDKIAFDAIKNNGLALQFVSDDLKRDCPDYALEAVDQNPFALQFISPVFSDDSEKWCIAHALREDPKTLQYVNEELKDFANAYLRVVNNEVTLKDLPNFNHEQEIVSECVYRNGLDLQFASEEIKNNYDIVDEAVEQNGLALQFASEEIKNDYGIVDKAVAQNGLALQFASENLKSNKEIVDNAVAQNRFALQFASEKLRSDEKMFTN